MGTTALECEEFVLLFLDTEGTDAVGENASINNLLVMTTLLSSCLIYNSVGIPRNTDLQKMRYVGFVVFQSPDTCQVVPLYLESICKALYQ